MKKTLLTAFILAPLVAAAGGFNHAQKTGGATIHWDSKIIAENVGWTPVTVGSGGTVASRGPVIIPGAKSPVVIDVAAKVVGAGSLLVAASKLATPIGAALTLASVAAMLADQYQSIIRKPDGWEVRELDYQCATPVSSGLCSAPFALAYLKTVSVADSSCNWEYKCQRFTSDGTEISFVGATQTAKSPQMSQPKPLTDAGLAQDIDSKPQLSPEAQNDLQDALRNPALPSVVDEIETSGPPSVQGETKTKTETYTGPDGQQRTKTTTTTETINITYDGPKMTSTTTSTTTTNITNNTTNTTESNTTNTTTQQNETPPEEKPDQGICEMYPDILACKKLDQVPDEEIPKRSENITLQDGLNFGGGGCLPDLVVNVFGTQVTVVSMSTPCGWIETYLKPFILLLASISAVFIIYPRTD